MSTKYSHTLTLFRDNAETNLVFTHTRVDDKSRFVMEKLKDGEEGKATQTLELNHEAFEQFRSWAALAVDEDESMVVVDSTKSDTQVKFATTAEGKLRVVLCPAGAKRKVSAVLDDHQRDRFLAWVHRTK